MYRREMTLKSGEWFYGAAGAQEIRNVHKSVIESLGQLTGMVSYSSFDTLIIYVVESYDSVHQ